MHQRLKLALIGSSLLFTVPALAQDAPAGDTTAPAGDATATGDATAPANPDPNATGTTTPTVGATADGTVTVAWPQEIVNRPYTVGKSAVAAYGDLDIAHISISFAGMTASATQEGLHIGGAYGVTDKVNVGLDYAFPIAGDGTDDSKGKGPLTIFGAFNLTHNDKMSVTASAQFVLDLCGGIGQDGCTSTKEITAGLGAKYLVTPKVAIFTGAPFGPGPVGQHLQISLEDGNPINFLLPVGVGLQATPQLFVYAEPTLAAFRLKKPDGDMSDTAAFYFSDGLGAPTTFGAWFALNKNLDVGANLFDDLKNAGDFYSISLGARWYK